MFNFLFVQKKAQSVEKKLAGILDGAKKLQQEAVVKAEATTAAIQVLGEELARIETVKAELKKLGL